MTRKHKALGLTLVVAFAMSAIAASAAQAETTTFEASEYPAYLTGTQITHNGKALHEFTAGSRTIACTGANFNATLNEAQHEVTVEPTYSGCAAGALPVTVTFPSECHFILHGGQGTTEHHFINGTVDLTCTNPNTVVAIHIYSTAHNHTTNISLCTITVTQFQNLGNITYTNTTSPEANPKDLDLTVELTNIPVHIHGSALLCGSSTTTSYTGATTVRAFSNAAHTTPINLTVNTE